jgi:hypothetical protein
LLSWSGEFEVRLYMLMANGNWGNRYTSEVVVQEL